MLVARPDERITMEEIFHHPWLNEDLKLPFMPHPYPNTLKSSEIKENIVEHMSQVLEVGVPYGIKQDLLINKATSLYAIYCLLMSRVARYEKEFSTKVTRVRSKKKVSKDHGFYDDEDSSDASSTVTAPVTIGRKTGVSYLSGIRYLPLCCIKWKNIILLLFVLYLYLQLHATQLLQHVILVIHYVP